MADWSELPKELIREIFNHLNSPIDTLRFRFVCSAWRQSTSSATTAENSHLQFPLSLPTQGIFLFKRSIFHLSPSESSNVEFPANPTPWVIKSEEKTPNSFNLYFPLSTTQVTPLPISFPRAIDLSNVRIRELGHDYILRYPDEVSFTGRFFNYIAEDVAYLPGESGDHFFILTVHISGRLALYNSAEDRWCIIRDDDVDLTYDDVIVFNGEFYAVDNSARTVLVELDGDCSLSLVASPFSGGNEKRLVEMDGELMLVNIYVALPPWDDDDQNLEYLDDFVPASRSSSFRVYRLDREEKNWVEVEDLGNNILFVGVASTFSASTVDFPSLKGNCIYFSFPSNLQRKSFHEDDDVFRFNCGCVYNLEDASTSLSKLFWPLPSWITPSSLERKYIPPRSLYPRKVNCG